jgi:hypothetical protein
VILFGTLLKVESALLANVIAFALMPYHTLKRVKVDSDRSNSSDGR